MNTTRIILIAALIAAPLWLSYADETRAGESTVPPIPSQTQPATRPQPNPSLSPADVVKIQMEALQHNDFPQPDAGIATVWRFASPQNRQATGPFDHFSQIVKSPQYASMIGFKSIEYSNVQMIDGQAQLVVRLVDVGGKRLVYMFVLGKQTDGEFKDCWMNEGARFVGEDPLHGSPPKPPADDDSRT